MKKLILMLFIIVTQSCATHMTMKDAIKTRTIKDGTLEYYLDSTVMDQVSKRIAIHARDYPPAFKNPKQEKEIKEEMERTLQALDVFFIEERNDPEFLIRLGFFYSMGHNLDILGSAEKAERAFKKLLRIEPNHPRGNYLYGMFLSSTAMYQAESIKFLEKAIGLGIDDAKYTLGLVCLRNGSESVGVKYLEDFAKEYPKSDAAMMLKAYKEGKLMFHATN
ncbi:MAG: hypothetical protein GY705_29475 [Bacteroidetes bacterium]|nr:hypothetical protein [Bacteroidota bacterium]